MSKRKQAPIEVFISYHHTDKKVAGKVKDFLEKFGMKAFLAHDNLNPADDWPKEIVNHLQSCDVFMPILSKNFEQSEWTDQETGIAYFNNKIILPLSVYVMPYGFIKKYQNYRIKPRDFDNSCAGIIKGFEQKKKRIRDGVVKGTIKVFSDSSSFEEAGFYANLLLQFDKLSQSELYNILSAARFNDQIYKSFIAQKHLQALYKKHEHLISNRLWNTVKSKFRN